MTHMNESHIWMSYVLSESWHIWMSHTYEWVTFWVSHDTYGWVTHMNELRFEWVMTHVDESWYMNESHIWMSLHTLIWAGDRVFIQFRKSRSHDTLEQVYISENAAVIIRRFQKTLQSFQKTPQRSGKSVNVLRLWMSHVLNVSSHMWISHHEYMWTGDRVIIHGHT